ncbi:hypothetical protein [Vandammella animalimorsus]|uniref:hypothetical protein n=1 Tax=Vandammella animalimorsus TaxID=2029117 RepID=UPI0011C3B15B|nr:hypothetical protein [Vandammella animalimorsus]
MRNIAILLFTGFLGTNIQGHERANIYHTDLPQIYKNEVQTARYVIKINPLYSESFAQEAKNNGYNLPSKESLKNNSFNINQKDLERPATRYVADKIAAAVSKKPIKITSWVANEFIMDLSENEAKIISSQKGVSSVEKIKAAKINVTLSSAIAEGDIFSDSEIIPWWKIYTNTNDLMNFGVNSPPIYVIDGPMAPPISPEVNLALNYNLTYVPNTNLWLYWHAAHVNGVIGSKNNNNQIRGINPNHPIMHYGTGLLDHQIIDALTKK